MRLQLLLKSYLQSATQRADRNKHQIEKLRQSHRDVQAALTRPLALVENGLMEADAPNLKVRLLGLKLQRDDLSIEIKELQERLSSNQAEITPERIEQFAKLLRAQWENGSAEFRQAYVRILMQEVRVTKKEIRISGSKSILAKAASHDVGATPPAVLSFVREWRTRQDSNLRPLPPEGSALSS